MNPHQSDLFFMAEYVLSALIILFLTYRKSAFDIRKPIDRKTFARRLPVVIITVLISIGLMTGVYLLHLDPRKNLWLIGAIELLMTLISNVILGSSWLQRFQVYPRGRELAIIMILMFMVSDLFMPSGIKYAILAVGTAIGLVLPNQWDDWMKKK